jgi:hypothetical protein
MMRKTLVALALLALPLAPAAFAADQAPPLDRPAPPTAEQKAQWEAMTPEQRKAKHEEMRAKREANMTPEQRAKHEARRKEWEAMTPEQRAAKRQQMQERRGQKRERPNRK